MLVDVVVDIEVAGVDVGLGAEDVWAELDEPTAVLGIHDDLVASVHVAIDHLEFSLASS